jgi:hypothetical protein
MELHLQLRARAVRLHSPACRWRVGIPTVTSDFLDQNQITVEISRVEALRGSYTPCIQKFNIF